VLGLELDRAGLDFRGRYTVPSEYFIASAPRPYIKEWLEQAQKSWWNKAAEAVARGLSWTATHTGLIAAILLLALLSRLLVMPISLKAERDQIRSRELAEELAALKERLKTDPRRLGRAMSAFYKRHGLTPVRNLLGLLFLPLMAISVTAVQLAASGTAESLLWMLNIAERDPSFVLPVLFAILIALYLDIAFARNRNQRILVWLITLPVLTATGALLSAAADVYMIASAALLLVQRAIVSGQLAKLREFWRDLHDDGIVALQDVDRLKGCGNKAYRLAQLRMHGIAVPDGWVLTSRFLAQFAHGTPQWRRRHLDRLWRQLGVERVAVRSSAASEDGSDRSFAGVFETVLNVDRAGLKKAITEVAASFDAARVESYGAKGESGNILVQRMVDAEYAGVLFTQDPAASGLAIVELVRGTAEKLVSGAVVPEAFRCGRISGRPIGERKAPIDLTPLVHIGHRAEETFGAPQDIEWTYREGCFYLVQSRDITGVLEGAGASGIIRREEKRVLDLTATAPADEVVFAQNELAEMLPRPTPLSLSMMEAMWASGGSVDLACRSLGLAYQVGEDQPNYVLTIFGRLYVDKRQEHARAPKLSSLALRRLEKRADRIEREFREEFLPGFLRDMMLREAVDFDRLATADIFAMLEEAYNNFVGATHVAVDVINIAASLYLDRAKNKLVEHGLDPATYLAHVPEGVYSHALAEAKAAPRGMQRGKLLTTIGHRAVLDYELAQPRYEETPEVLDALCETQTPVHALHTNTSGMAGDPALWEAVRRARRFQTLKEDAKHQSLRELAVCRRAILALDERLGFDGLMFYLTFAELFALRNHSVDELRDVASNRKHQSDIFRDVASLAATLTVIDLEDATAGIEHDQSADDAVVRGTRVSGSSVVEGRARVIAPSDAESGSPIADFENGDIIVSSMVHPAWLSYFRDAGGFVCEIGGWLSHTAIVAREFDLPMIIGTRGLRTIEDGSLIRLHLDGTVEIIEAGERQRLRAVAAA
jgi:membrane protein insertase Oxa1/YidC/SpoIIIJ/phosphohistidine swiveling domain-containing protein